MTKHEFGGPWTLIKLDLLKRYLAFFNTALKQQPQPEYPFNRIYIDAFAGTGACEIQLNAGFRTTVKGSAKIAIDTEPPFHQIHLVDLNNKHVTELQALEVNAYRTKLSIYKDDANVALRRIVEQINWRKTRGVLFLDPYGMSVEWATLELIASTQALDVWYLFPLSAVYRQAARDFSRIGEAKSAVLDKVMGTPEWRNTFYELSTQNSFLEEPVIQNATRTASPEAIAAFVHERLLSIFHGWVSLPILLPDRGPPMFALFFAVSNPSKSAVKLSKKAAEHLFLMLKEQKIGLMPNSGDTVLETQQRDLFYGPCES